MKAPDKDLPLLQEADFVHEQLDAWLLDELKRKTGRVSRDEEDFFRGLYDQEGKLMAGLEGRFLFESFYLDLLAIDPECRNQKLGSRLMQELEAECRRRNIHTVFLSTQDYQAPGFYQKLGYEICGVMENVPFSGTVRYFLKKTLQTDSVRTEEPDRNSQNRSETYELNESNELNETNERNR